MKLCKKCNILKLKSEFYIHKKYKDGIWNICKKCAIDQNKKRYNERKQSVANNSDNKLKQCTKCKQKKEIIYFRKSNINKDGASLRCKCCLNEYKKQYCLKNKEKIIEYRKRYYKKNSEQILNRAKNSRKTDNYKKYLKEYKEKNKNRLTEFRKEYYKKNKTELLMKAKQYFKSENGVKNRKKYYNNKRKNDICFKLAGNIRTRIRRSLKRNSRSNLTYDLIGLSIRDYKQYLESKFLEGMSWSNYSADGWHIDHIRPCASFDLTDPEQQKQCFHYTNTQPMWAKDNIIKGAKYDLV